MRRSAILLAVTALVTFVGTIARASVTFTPPDSEKKVQMGSVMLKSPTGAVKASGTATFLRNIEKTKYVMTLQVTGLDATKVYTVWFAKMGGKKDAKGIKMEGVGKTPFTLKVGKGGKAEISYELASNPLEKWTTLEIVAHPDKNPRNMSKIVPVMTANMAKLMQ
jgi:hypothetical protein